MVLIPYAHSLRNSIYLARIFLKCLSKEIACMCLRSQYMCRLQQPPVVALNEKRILPGSSWSVAGMKV